MPTHSQCLDLAGMPDMGASAQVDQRAAAIHCRGGGLYALCDDAHLGIKGKHV